MWLPRIYSDSNECQTISTCITNSIVTGALLNHITRNKCDRKSWGGTRSPLFLATDSMARLNIKISSYKYKNSHNKDKTVSRPSYIYNGNHHTWKDCLCIETGPWSSRYLSILKLQRCTFYNGWNYLLESKLIYVSKSGPWSTAHMALTQQDCRSLPIQGKYFIIMVNMMTSSNGNTFRFTGPLCGEFTGHRWIPLTKASGRELWCFIWTAPEQTAE